MEGRHPSAIHSGTVHAFSGRRTTCLTGRSVRVKRGFADAESNLTESGRFRTMRPRISVFPKYHFDELVSGEASFEQWIRDAAMLGGEGLEHYDGFFRSLDPAGVDPILRTIEETGQRTSMICFSPDFTHPDREERLRQVDRQKA